VPGSLRTAADAVTGGVHVGVLADPEAAPVEIGQHLDDVLPSLLHQRDEDREWHVDICYERLPAGDLGTHVEMFDHATARAREEGWDLVVCVTDLPLRDGRQPLVADVATGRRVVVLSLPGFGATRLRRRVTDVVVEIVGDLTAQADAQAAADGPALRLTDRDLPGPFRLVSPSEQGVDARVVATRGRWRLLVGMVRDNRPWRLLFGLRGAIVAAFAFSAFWMINPSVWQLSAAHGPLRLALIAAGTVGAMVAWLILYHRLWEPVDQEDAEGREQALLFNASTVPHPVHRRDDRLRRAPHRQLRCRAHRHRLVGAGRDDPAVPRCRRLRHADVAGHLRRLHGRGARHRLRERGVGATGGVQPARAGTALPAARRGRSVRGRARGRRARGDVVMGIALGAAGAVVLMATILDMITTVMRTETRSGPLTRLVTTGTWRVLHAMTRRVTRPQAPEVTGVIITITVVSVWLLLTFLGWYLVFSAAPSAVVDGTAGDPADAWARAYYTAYILSTLGIGDYVPGGPAWQVLTGIAATAGFALATLVITYMASLTSAVAHKRQFARTVTQLGATPQDVVLAAWDGQGFPMLADVLRELTTDLNALTEEHLTYPVLYLYKAANPSTAHWPAVATLHDTLLILDEVVDERVQPPALAMAPARAAIAAYIGTAPILVDSTTDRPPPPPSVDRLHDAGIPTRDRSATEASLSRSTHVRCTLASVLRHQGVSQPRA
jgi:hypothetical protein